MKNELSSLPNIGSVLAGKLCEAGINTAGELNAAGSKNAFLRIRALDKDTCVCSLFALEGAVQGVRWHDLDPQKKEELRAFYNMTRISDK